MKTYQVIFTSFLLVASFSIKAQAQSYIYPELDKALIQLWEFAENKNVDLYESQVAEVELVWSQVQQDLPKEDVDHFQFIGFNRFMNNLIADIHYACANKNDRNIKSLSFLALREFEILRHCTSTPDYPLDLLIEAYNNYQELHFIVHDPMLDLFAWFEFEDFVDNFEYCWFLFSKDDLMTIKEYFPEMSMETLNKRIEDVNTCFEDFRLSLETAYRTDFEMPCDQLGKSLKELIFLFGSVQNVH